MDVWLFASSVAAEFFVYLYICFFVAGTNHFYVACSRQLHARWFGDSSVSVVCVRVIASNLFCVLCIAMLGLNWISRGFHLLQIQVEAALVLSCHSQFIHYGC